MKELTGTQGRIREADRSTLSERLPPFPLFGNDRDLTWAASVSVRPFSSHAGTMANQYIASNSWPDERVELLKKLWAEGLSASHIAARLGGNITRNSVLGKAHRLGIVIPGARTVRTGFPNKANRQRAKKRASQLDNAVFGKSLFKSRRGRPTIAERTSVQEALGSKIEDIARKTLLELDDGDCRYVVGEPSGVAKCFCALPQVVGSKYCLSHFLRCTEAPKPRKPILEIVADTSAPSKERETA